MKQNPTGHFSSQNKGKKILSKSLPKRGQPEGRETLNSSMRGQPKGKGILIKKLFEEKNIWVNNFKKRKIESFLLLFLIFILFAVDYPFLDKAAENFLSEPESVYVSRVIDGDTIIGNNESVRLLGINTPERGEELYNEAKEFLESEIINKTVRLEFGRERKDRYNRTLAYVFFNNKNVNLELVEIGFGNYYFPSGKDIYYEKFKIAWNHCIENNLNLCEKSQDKCSECIFLENFDFKNQKIVFRNKCDFSCEITEWEIKDEGRKKFIFPRFILESNKEVNVIVGNETNNNENLFWKNEEYVWTKSGDTLFLRDSKGKLVLWRAY